MSYQLILTVRRHSQHGVFLMAQSVRPGLMDTRMEDEIRLAVLDQAARQAREMIDKEMIHGDETTSPEPTEDFKLAVHRLDSFHLLDAEDDDLELEGADEEEEA